MSRILVVEDDSMVSEVIGDIIKLLGHQSVHAGSGPEALQAAAAEKFDLAIVDLELPRLPGIEVATGLMKAQPDIRIIFATGYSLQEDHVDPDEPRILGLIRKPFEIAELQSAVEKALRRH